jgi:hypothetical protein
MSDDELAELLKYSSPKELYVVTWNNILRLLYCPFEVIVLSNVGDLKLGDIVWVEEVKITPELITVFVIYNKAYYYYHFDFINE